MYQQKKEQFVVDDKREWYYTMIENDILDDTDHFQKVYDKIVYIAISRFKNITTQQAFPSIKRLATMCMCSENAVRESIKRLEDLKLLEVIRTKNETGNNNPNIYRLLPIPELLRGTSPHEVGTSQYEGGVLHDMKEGTSPGEDELEKVNYKNINNNIHQQLVELYHEICISYPKVLKITPIRKKHINARLKDYTLDDYKQIFLKAESSDFMKGKNDNGWKANFDWLLNENNVAKVLEGKYDNKTRAPIEQSKDKKELMYEILMKQAEGG